MANSSFASWNSMDFFFSKLLDPWLVEFLEPMIQRANGTEFGKSYRFIWEPGL